MTTENKDFKVKNGIQVNGSGSFIGTVSAADPTLPEHLVTKAYLEQMAVSGKVEVSALEPENPENGLLWLDTIVQRLKVYYEDQWIVIANFEDTLNVPDHVHDGSGLIIARFVDAGNIPTPYILNIAGGLPDTIDFNDTYDGGIVVDNY